MTFQDLVEQAERLRESIEDQQAQQHPSEVRTQLERASGEAQLLSVRLEACRLALGGALKRDHNNP